MRYFLFQLDHDSTSAILEYLDGDDDRLSLPFRNHRQDAGSGDQVILWTQGPDACAWGAGQINGPEELVSHPRSYREPERGESLRPSFPVTFDGFLPRNVNRSELKELPVFEDFPWRHANVQNPFELSEDQYNAIFDRAEGSA